MGLMPCDGGDAVAPVFYEMGAAKSVVDEVS